MGEAKRRRELGLPPKARKEKKRKQELTKVSSHGHDFRLTN